MHTTSPVSRLAALLCVVATAACDCSGGYLIYRPDAGVVVVERDAGAGEPGDAGAPECDPQRTRQCVEGDAVICSGAGAIVERESCALFGCNAVTGRCNECPPGTTTCDDDELVACQSDGTTNPTTQRCSFGCAPGLAGEARCNACEPESTSCSGTDLVSCGEDGEVADTLACAYGCNAATVPASCNECDPAQQRQCHDDVSVTCSPQGFVATEEDCGEDGCNLLSGRCNTCEPGASFCVATGIGSCEPDGTLSVDVVPCPRGCAEDEDAGPACLACTPGATECHDDNLVTCDPEGVITASVPCDEGCTQVTGAAGRCNECAPSTTRCEGDDSVACTADGYEATRTACPYGCDENTGACYACTPSASECLGERFVVCDADGNVVSSEDCADLDDACNVGTCTPTGCVKDPAPLHDSFCDTALSKICCDGSCIDSDESNCGACGNACATPAAGCNPADVCTRNTCIDKGIVVINELMINPGSITDAEEWVELYNPTGRAIDLRGWVLKDDGSDIHNITSLTNVVIPAGGYAVLMKDDAAAGACGVSGVYTYGNFQLGNNTGDEVVIGVPGCEVDRFNYASNFVVAGAAKALKPSFQSATGNDNPANWCTATTALSCGDKGTPGAPNDCP